MEGFAGASAAWTRLAVRDGVFQRVDTVFPSPHPALGDDWLSPGWIDLQINGIAGISFGDPCLSPTDVRRAAEVLWSEGVTHFLPTLITDSLDRMAAALTRLSSACSDPQLARSVLGFHLEGPFLSSEDGPRGAHPREHCRPPAMDAWNRLQDAAGGKIRLLTLAPELPGAIPFIERIVQSGVRVAIGHTAADRETILAAVRAGATLATHLGNAAHDRIQRHHNYIFDQLGEDDLYASLIADGHHLPPHLLKSFIRAKRLERAILVSDAVQYTGLPAGVYDGGHRSFEVRGDGYIGVVGEPRLAGSGLILRRGIENMIRFAGVSLADALRAASAIPAEFLGASNRLGRLLPGMEASFVRFAWNPERTVLRVRETVLAGVTVFARQEHP